MAEFEGAIEPEEEEPKWTSRSEDFWPECQRQRETQGLERERHSLSILASGSLLTPLQAEDGHKHAVACFKAGVLP